MKRTILILIAMFFVFDGFSQKAVATHQQIESFKNTTTCVVLDDDIFNTYNNAIKKAVDQSWTITPVKYITMDEFKEYMHKSEYSFLIRTKVYPEKKNNTVAYTFLSLVNGEQDKSFGQLPEICSFPLSYYNVDYDKYDYKMGALLLFIQNHINITFDNENLTDKNILQYYNNNTSDINSKTLYITSENLQNTVNSKNKIAKFYSGTIEIVEPDDIEDAINQKNEDIIILHIVTPSDNSGSVGRCYKMLLGASDGKLYYYDSHAINSRSPGKFLKNDFKKLK